MTKEGALEFSKEDFAKYKFLVSQLNLYINELATLKDKYTISDTVKDYRSGFGHSIVITGIQDVAYKRDKAIKESIVIDLSQKIWIIKRTIDMAAGCNIDPSMQTAVAMWAYTNENLDNIARLLYCSKSTVSRYINAFFCDDQIKKIFENAVIDSRKNLVFMKK